MDGYADTCPLPVHLTGRVFALQNDLGVAGYGDRVHDVHGRSTCDRQCGSVVHGQAVEVIDALRPSCIR